MFTNNSPENILHTAYEAKMISSGDNSPSIKIKGTKLQYLLVLIDVVKLTFFLTDISQMAVVRDIRDQYIDTNNPPASSAVEVRKLINDNLLIEVEAIAVAN